MIRKLFSLTLAALLLTSCQAGRTSITNQGGKVLAIESFLADIAQNVAGDTLKVDSLIPVGVDPHGFEVTPQDMVKITGADVLIMNGCGFESWIQNILTNIPSTTIVIQACKGITPRTQSMSEIPLSDPNAIDPHFWMDPTLVIQYVDNIRKGLGAYDPTNRALYDTNAKAYVDQLMQLDAWIRTTVQMTPEAKRLIVTNHESFGYFADRYHFQIIGTILASISSSASPSAQQLATLVDHIRKTGTKVIFLETGSNPQLANQLASETGITVISDLYTHSLTTSDGDAPTYIKMMKWDTLRIVKALSQ